MEPPETPKPSEGLAKDMADDDEADEAAVGVGTGEDESSPSRFSGAGRL